MSMINIKEEPVTPAASLVATKRRRPKSKVSPSPNMPLPMDELGIKAERTASSPRKRVSERREGKLLGGQEMKVEGGDLETEGVQKTSKKKTEKKEKRARLDCADEVPKLKAALKKYEATVTKLVQKFKVEQTSYKTEIQELQETNQTLRDEIMGIRNTIYEMTSQRDLESELVMKLKGDNTELLTKNGQLEQDLAKMIQNIQHSDGVLAEMQKRMSDREAEMQNLSTEKKYLVQQLADMRRLSSSIDTFSPPPGDGRKGSITGASDASRTCCREGLMGWLFGQERSTSRMFVLGILLSIGMAYVLQNLNAAEAINTNDCEYERELFPKEWREI